MAAASNQTQVGGYPASTFSHLARSVAAEDFECFGRSAEQEAEYARFRDRIVLEGWRSVSDYIRVCKLGFEERRDGDGRLVAGDAPTLRPDEGGARTILIANDFPYHFAPGIGHWVLWKIGAPLKSEDVELAKEQLRASENAVEFVVFENPPQRRSILDVAHAQVIFTRAGFNVEMTL